MPEIEINAYWNEIRARAKEIATREPSLSGLIDDAILERSSFEECLTYRMTRKLINHATSL
ncbi:MAG: serine O-acetyltransferase, partial [Coraliomargarita sp.]